MSTDEKRDELRERIEAGEKRAEERSLADSAREAGELATEFVKAHPVATVAGVAVLGIVIGAMTKPGRRLGSRAADLTSYAAEAGIAYAMGVIDAAGDFAGDVKQASGDAIEDIGDSIDRNTRKAKREGSYLASTARDTAHDYARRAGRKAGRSFRGAKMRLPH
ncbi:hypothetical protein [Erythrobacter litoralis]|uniref:DUF883 domain-containing protein n=1 Tax=Erythrobacter litoralis (strain HTCC2594) TaxID=314225 RepID=Q2NAQ6_ERYLH|nr:hypothetical protein [Erythrobacter litoralis]ABC63235.1 hypothetical protein ELI_05715 [Erythrobacter litoralis HTCC2594]